MTNSLFSTNNHQNVKASLSIRKELLQNELDLVKSANLEDMPAIEAWTAIGTNKEMAYSTHGAFRYFGKFPPPIATHLIFQHTNINDLVWDPMSGSGTTGVESLLLGRSCMLNDVSPLSRLLAKVKTHYIEESELKNSIQRVVENYKPISFEDTNFRIQGLRNVDHWFLPETIRSLLGLRAAIELEKNPELQDFLWVAFAATVRRVSRATTQQGRLFLDVETALEDALAPFIKRADIAIKGISSLPSTQNVSIDITNYNLVEPFPVEHHKKAKLVILHPPYFNSYKYSSVNSLELAWLGFDYSKVRKQEVREFFKVGKPENVTHYVKDMVQAIMNASELLLPNGIMALMIGDTIMKGVHIPVTKMILKELEDSNIKVELLALRVPKYTEATWVASQRRKGSDVGITLYDYVVTLRKEG